MTLKQNFGKLSFIERSGNRGISWTSVLPLTCVMDQKQSCENTHDSMWNPDGENQHIIIDDGVDEQVGGRHPVNHQFFPMPF
jgi:hypothetical protein